VFVVGVAIVLYEIHLRIPLLRFLFSGKPQAKPHKSRGASDAPRLHQLSSSCLR
jgi:hypothetical protein